MVLNTSMISGRNGSMEWTVLDQEDFMRRKYSNDTMRKLHKKIAKDKSRDKKEGYNETLDRLEMYINDKRLRTEEEILADRQYSMENL